MGERGGRERVERERGRSLTELQRVREGGEMGERGGRERGGPVPHRAAEGERERERERVREGGERERERERERGERERGKEAGP